MSADIAETVRNMREYFNTGETKTYAFRLRALKELRKAIKAHEGEIYDALIKDLNKYEYETFFTELTVVYGSIDYSIDHLRLWMTPKPVWPGFANQPGYGKIMPEPFGVSLIMAPWNFPFHLTIVPLVGAIAAGCCAVLKPSNYSAATSAVIDKICKEAFFDRYVTVVLGGHEQNAELLDQHFDFIFFTGGTKVGKIVLEKAAKFATPVELELGGKSPVIITKDCNMQQTCDRLCWGKYTNAGQICVCPDYVLVDESIHDEFVETFKKSIRKYWYLNGELNPNFCHIISPRHFDRVIEVLDQDKVVFGGHYDRDTLTIEPTIMDNVEITDKVMSREIFGPIMPVLTYKFMEDAYDMIYKIGQNYNDCDSAKPLAMYIFTGSLAMANQALTRISSGGAAVNDTVLHVATLRLPFGGVGYSGLGNGYHGKESFNAFSHNKSVLVKLPGTLPIRKYYPQLDKVIRNGGKTGIDRLIKYFL